MRTCDVGYVSMAVFLDSHQEISALYRRFRTLDRGRKGYITADEFMTIPELSINPLAQRLVTTVL